MDISNDQTPGIHRQYRRIPRNHRGMSVKQAEQPTYPDAEQSVRNDRRPGHLVQDASTNRHADRNEPAMKIEVVRVVRIELDDDFEFTLVVDALRTHSQMSNLSMTLKEKTNRMVQELMEAFHGEPPF
jgi:hypothetical protein